MNSPRIDIGKGQWIALRDGLFIHVRTRRRKGLHILVAPESFVYRGPMSEPLLPTRAPLYVLGALVFVLVTGLSIFIQQVFRLSEERASLFWTLAPACIVTAGLVLWAFRRGWLSKAPSTVLAVTGCKVRIPHVLGGDLTMDTVLARFPTSAWYPPACPGPLFYWLEPQLPHSLDVATPALMMLAASAVAWRYGDPITAILSLLFVVPIAGRFLPRHIFKTAALPLAVHRARASLLKGDYDSASAKLREIREKTPDDPFANYFQAALAFMQGDLTSAAACLDVIQDPRIAASMEQVSHVHAPKPEHIRAMLEFVRTGHVQGAGKAVTLCATTERGPSLDAPAH